MSALLNEASPNKIRWDRHSSLTDRTQRSAKAFKFGLRGGSRRHFMDLSGDLRQPVKTQNPSKGELSHGIVEKDVHQGVQAGRSAAAGARGIDRGGGARAGSEPQRVAPLASGVPP